MNTAITTPSETMPTEAEYTYNDRYINRELSILDFHLRVLEQAVDPLHPLLERMNFLLIFSRNLDEFFEIRVASLNSCLSDSGRVSRLRSRSFQNVPSSSSSLCLAGI